MDAVLTRDEAIRITEAHLMRSISSLFDLAGCEFSLIPGHDGGRNVVYACEGRADRSGMIRISFLDDRRLDDLLAEVEFVRHLFEYGVPVANVIASRTGNMVEEIHHDDHRFFVCMFERARGKRLVENHFQYREGVPITEYFRDCGRVLGKVHQASKTWTPVHRRYEFFDQFNASRINGLIPPSLPVLKQKMLGLLDTLETLVRDGESFGMIHFDFSDGNYTIDFETGEITVFDFDDSCFGWYLYDLAELWRSGTGWTQFEPNPGKRRSFMDEFFGIVLEGYRSETDIDATTLEALPLFVNVVVMENVVGAFERMRMSDEEPEIDEELSYLIKCLEDDIPYMGFFHDMYSAEAPFEYEERGV